MGLFCTKILEEHVNQDNLTIGLKEHNLNESIALAINTNNLYDNSKSPLEAYFQNYLETINAKLCQLTRTKSLILMMTTNKPFIDLESSTSIISCLEHYRRLLNERRLVRNAHLNEFAGSSSHINLQSEFQPPNVLLESVYKTQDEELAKKIVAYCKKSSRQSHRRGSRSRNRSKVTVNIDVVTAGTGDIYTSSCEDKDILETQSNFQIDRLVESQEENRPSARISQTQLKNASSNTTRACMKFHRKAQQTLTKLNQQVSFVLQDTMYSIDNIGLRARNTINEINETTMKYQQLKATLPANQIMEVEEEMETEIDQEKPPVAPASEEPPVTPSSEEPRVTPYVGERPVTTSSEEPPATPSSTNTEASRNEYPESRPTSPHEDTTDEPCDDATPAANICYKLPTNPKLMDDNEITFQRNKRCLKKLFKKMMTTPKLVKELTSRLCLDCLTRRKGQSDLHKELVKEFGASSSLVEFQTQMKLLPKDAVSKPKTKVAEQASEVIDGVLAEELFVPDRQINKILSLGNDSRTSGVSRMLSKVHKKKKHHVDTGHSKSSLKKSASEKYSDSIYFSKSKKKIKVSKDNIVSITEGPNNSNKFQMEKKKSTLPSSTVVVENTSHKVSRGGLTFKSGLDCFDILDEITLKDIQPIASEYPRKDHFGTDPYVFKIEDSYIYKLVYNCDHQHFLYMISSSKRNSIEPSLPLLPQLEADKPQMTFTSMLTERRVMQPLMVNKTSPLIVNKINPLMINKINKVRIPKKENQKPATIFNKPREHDLYNVRRKKTTSSAPFPRKVELDLPRPIINEVKRAVTFSKFQDQKKLLKCNNKKLHSHLKAKTNSYLNDSNCRYPKPVTAIQPVGISNKLKPKTSRASPEVIAKLRQYIVDPSLQVRNMMVTAMPVFVKTFDKPARAKKLENHLISCKSLTSFRACKKCNSQYSEVSTQSSSSPDIATKLSPYIYDPCREHPTHVTVMPATTAPYHDYITNPTIQPYGGDYNTHSSQNQPTYKFDAHQLFSKPIKQYQPNPKTKSYKPQKNPAFNLLSYLEKQSLVPQQPFEDLQSSSYKMPPPSKLPKKSYSSKIEPKSPKPQTPNTWTRSPPPTRNSNNALHPTMDAIKDRAAKPRRYQPPQQPLLSHTQMQQAKEAILENNIQKVIEMIETKIIDIISSPQKPHTGTFSTVEKEIIKILETIRKAETSLPLSTIEEKSDTKEGHEGKSETDEVELANSDLASDDTSSADNFATNERRTFQSNFLDNVDSTVNNFEKIAREIENQNRDNIPTKISPKSETKTRPKPPKGGTKRITPKEVQKIIEKKVDSINEIIDNINNQEIAPDSAVEEKIKSSFVIDATPILPAASMMEESLKLDAQPEKLEEVAIEKPKILAKVEEATTPRGETTQTQEVLVLSSKFDREKAIESDLVFETKLDKGVSADFSEQSLDAEANLNVNYESHTKILPKLQDTAADSQQDIFEDSQDNISMVEVPSLTSNVEVTPINILSKTTEDARYVTPFMQVLVRYRNECEARGRSPNILEFLETLKRFNNINSRSDTQIKKLSKIYYKKKVLMAQVLHQPQIQYPIDICHKVRQCSQLRQSLELNRKSLMSQALLFLRPLVTKYNSSSYARSNALIAQASIAFENDDSHGSLLKSLYSMVFVAMFCSLTLNYSCH